MATSSDEVKWEYAVGADGASRFESLWVQRGNCDGGGGLTTRQYRFFDGGSGTATSLHGLRRVATGKDAVDPEVTLCDLPEVALENAASYLHNISRALLCIAIGSSVAMAGTSRILSPEGEEQWSSLDFNELEEELTQRLTDDHISSILTLIDASHKLKSLKMTGCTLIRGHGLQPLRHSTVLQRLDIAIVKDREHPFRLSEEVVLPIVHDIMVKPNSSLVVVHRPFIPSIVGPSKAARQFNVWYEEYKRSRGINRKCKECVDDEYMGEDEDDGYKDVCYSCLEMFHDLCPSMRSLPYQARQSNLRMDNNCWRRYCRDCYRKNVFCCSWCGDDLISRIGNKRYCHECSLLTKCERCGHSACRGCTDIYFAWCAFCSKESCTSCVYFERWTHRYSGIQFSICEDCLDSEESEEYCWSNSSEDSSNSSNDASSSSHNSFDGVD